MRARLSVKEAQNVGGCRYTGLDGVNSGMHDFGASEPLKELLKEFGFTPDRVVEAAREQVAKAKKK